MPLGSVADVALAGAMAGWLLLSAACQISSPFERWLRRRDVLSLIPRWCFFAPRPAMHDFHLLYRDRDRDGAVSPWRMVPSCAPPRLLSAVWNPGRRHNKALIDVVQELLELTKLDIDPASVQLTVPYLALLTFVSGLARLDSECETQFAVARSRNGDEGGPEVLFVSALHRVC